MIFLCRSPKDFQHRKVFIYVCFCTRFFIYLRHPSLRDHAVGILPINLTKLNMDTFFRKELFRYIDEEIIYDDIESATTDNISTFYLALGPGPSV